jgi:hypothetical protein
LIVLPIAALMVSPALAQEDGFTETFANPSLPGWEGQHREEDGVI